MEKEIKRLLKIINKKTLLFPVIRSVVAGEYVDDEGIHHIVVITHLNDLEILANSATKKDTPKVRRAWKEGISICGRDDDDYALLPIPTFDLGTHRFEFIEASEVINHLEKNPGECDRYTGEAEIFGVEVKAFKNMDFLDSLPFDEEYKFVHSGGKKMLNGFAYLKYIKPFLSYLDHVKIRS